MKKIRKQLIILTLTLAFILIFSGTVSAAEWTVGPTGNYQTIQAAVDGSSNDDTITVNPNGTDAYTENIVVNRTGLLIKANGTVTVQPKNQLDPVFYIDSNGNNSTIQGFRIIGGSYDNSYSGFGLKNTQGCRITGNNILNAHQAIYVDGCTNITIDGNTISNSYSVGIHVYNSPSPSNIKVSNNVITNNREAIEFSNTNYGEISGNTIQNSGLNGIILFNSANNLISSNTVTGTLFAPEPVPGFWIGNGDGICLSNSNTNTISGNTIANNANNGIHLRYGCYSNTINGNNLITGNPNGIYLEQVSNAVNYLNTITGNTINNNVNGINLYGSNSNTISGNGLSGNSNVGIFINQYSNDNNIINNIANNNGYGIYTHLSRNNLIQGNTLNGNTLDGLTLEGEQTDSNTVTGNTITGNHRHGIISNSGGNSIHYNRISGNSGYQMFNRRFAENAQYNWWGSNDNPFTSGKFGGEESDLINYSPWLYMTINANPTTINNGGTSLITVSFNNYSSDGTSYTSFDPAAGHIPDGVPGVFSLTNGPLGTFNGLASPVTVLTSGGLAYITFNATSAGIQNVNAATDNQIVPTSITINDPASIGDFVWNDLDADGVQDAGEPGISNVVVNLYDNIDTLIATTTTNASGNYVFNNLIPGTYSLGFILPSGYVFSPQDQGGNDATDSDADTATGRTITTTLASGENDLTWDAGMHIIAPTSLIVENVTGNKGQIVNLKAKLIDDNTGNGIPGQTISFKVFGVDAGTATTGADGVATLSYPINLVGGNWDIDAAFTGTTTLADSLGTGSLKVNQSSIYVLTTVSKTNPTIGEIVTLTFKLGNNGPDPAEDVVFTYVIPDGMEYVDLETEQGYPEPVYDPAKRTITWTLGTVPKLDPWFKFHFRNLVSGTFNIIPTVTTATYDPGLNSNIQSITINAAEVQTTVNAASNTVGMQETGIPLPMMVLAILMVLGGLIGSRRR